MGVSRLLSYCLEHREKCVKYVDLIDVARDRGGIEILVDYYSFQQQLMFNFWKALSGVSNNPYLRLLGGEYHSLDRYVKKFITDLQSLDIHLVMFVDGAKGSSRSGTEQKLETWRKRHFQDIQRMRKVISVFEGHLPIDQLPWDVNIRPVLLEVQIFETLRECKCEVVQCPFGEADYVIARNLQNRPKALAVLSNDSDFCVFTDCKFIPNELFDLKNDLQMDGPGSLPEKPIRLMVGMIISTKVAQMLEFEDEKQLIELSIISGNDFTTSHLHKIKSKMAFKAWTIPELAAWVKQYGSVDNHPVIRKEMDHNTQFADSVYHSRHFYMLDMLSDQNNSSSLLTKMIAENIEKGLYPPSIMGIHRNFYWHRMLLEDCTPGQPCAEVALMELRRFVYRMVLTHSENIVVEYGRVPYEEFSTNTVYTVRLDRFLDIINVQPDKKFPNLRTFHRIMSHLEPGSETEWYKRYGWNVGYICYILRYFLILNTRCNLYITQGEFMSLIPLVFSRVDEGWYQSLHIIPTLRCITVGNWFQDLIRHTYDFIGKLLHLSKDFSTPARLFSGSAWVAFYMVTNHEAELRGPGGITNNSISRVKNDITHIFKEKRHMMKYVVNGYYDIDTNF